MTTQSTVTAINPLAKSVWQPLTNAERAKHQKPCHCTERRRLQLSATDNRTH